MQQLQLSTPGDQIIWSQLGINRALIVDYPWIDLLLAGVKPWEMRSRMTNIRGRIGLIPKGTGLVVGSIELMDSLTARTHEETVATHHLHRIPAERLQQLQKWRYPWVMETPNQFAAPIPYSHPRGAVTWVKL